jgi:hypothetical protein
MFIGEADRHPNEAPCPTAVFRRPLRSGLINYLQGCITRRVLI